jgi:hypothetical protein
MDWLTHYMIAFITGRKLHFEKIQMMAITLGASIFLLRFVLREFFFLKEFLREYFSLRISALAWAVKKNIQ